MVEELVLQPDVAAEFRRSVERFLRPDDPAREKLRDAPLLGIPIIELDFQKLNPDEFTKARAQDAVSGTGWLVLARSPGGDIYGADIMHSGAGGKLETGGILRDPAFPDMVRRVEELLHRDEFKGEAKFQIKLLSIPALLTDALWLTDGERHLIVPIRFEGRLLPELSVIHLNSFFEDLGKIVPAYREFDDVSGETPSTQP